MGRRRCLLPVGPRRVTRSQTQVDRISALPDDMLCQILSRLRCIRTAARTGILSHRWRGIWTGLGEVSFRGLTPDVIHAVLDKLSSTLVSDFDIHLCRGTGDRGLNAASVTSLLDAVASLSPKKLVVTIPVRLYETVNLPRFAVATSIELDVQNIPFALPQVTDFPLLETLNLSACIVDLATLVPRCPRLRVLSVTKTPCQVDKVMVHSASLQELVVSSFRTTTINIVAPALKKLTMALDMGKNCSLSLVAPMVEEVSWRCLYYSMYVMIDLMWRVCSLNVRTTEKKMQLGELTDIDDEGSHAYRHRRAHILSLDIIDKCHDAQRTFTEELEKIPVTSFSVLELKIVSYCDIVGPLVFKLLGICTTVQKLDMSLQETPVQAKDYCSRRFAYEDPYKKWRTKAISFNISEVEIKGLKGGDHEIDFLKMLFMCAPMLQTMTLKLSDKIHDDWYNIILDTVQDHPCVNSNVCIG